MSMDITVVAKKEVLKKLKKLGNDAPRALKNAVNATARDTKKMLALKAQEEYTVKTMRFKNAITQKNATNAYPVAVLKVKGDMQELENFEMKQSTPSTGVRVKVKQSGSLKELISTRESGRAFTLKLTKGGDDHSVENAKTHNAIAQRNAKPRYKTHAFYGPSDPEMIGGKEVFEELKPDIQEMLHDNINRQIEKILGGK